MLRRPSLLFGVSCRGTRCGVFFFAWYLSVSFVTNRIFNMRLKNTAGGAWGLFVASEYMAPPACFSREKSKRKCAEENLRWQRWMVFPMCQPHLARTRAAHLTPGVPWVPAASQGVPSPPAPPAPLGPPGLDGSRNDRRLRRMSSWLRKRLWRVDPRHVAATGMGWNWSSVEMIVESYQTMMKITQIVIWMVVDVQFGHFLEHEDWFGPTPVLLFSSLRSCADLYRREN